jgi:hypothetical protein
MHSYDFETRSQISIRPKELIFSNIYFEHKNSSVQNRMSLIIELRYHVTLSEQ